MKRIMLLLMTALIIAMLFACSAEKTKYTEENDTEVTDDETVNASNDENTDADDENEPEVDLVTREWIIEHFDFSEEELEGIDVDAVIQYRKFTEEILKHKYYTKEKLLNLLKLYDEEIKTDISYLFEGGQPEEKIPVSQIKTIAFLDHENEEKHYWHICVQEKKAYYCFGYWENMDVKEECEYSETLTDEGISELLSCLDKANLHKWKASYIGEDDGSTGTWSWDLGIELTDGTVYSWSGGGMLGENKPKEYQSVKDAIITTIF